MKLLVVLYTYSGGFLDSVSGPPHSAVSSYLPHVSRSLSVAGSPATALRSLPSIYPFSEPPDVSGSPAVPGSPSAIFGSSVVSGSLSIFSGYHIPDSGSPPVAPEPPAVVGPLAVSGAALAF